jgi:hypothetical protein
MGTTLCGESQNSDGHLRYTIQNTLYRFSQDGQRLDLLLHTARAKLLQSHRARPVLSFSEPDAQVVELPEARLRNFSSLMSKAHPLLSCSAQRACDEAAGS